MVLYIKKPEDSIKKKKKTIGTNERVQESSRTQNQYMKNMKSVKCFYTLITKYKKEKLRT